LVKNPTKKKARETKVLWGGGGVCAEYKKKLWVTSRLCGDRTPTNRGKYSSKLKSDIRKKKKQKEKNKQNRHKKQTNS